MRLMHLVPFCLFACGDNTSSTPRPDAPDQQTADAAIDGPPVLPCSFTEAADGTNDDLFGSGTAETTGLSFTDSTIAICGQINNGHFNTSEMNVDVDSYRITVPADTFGILYLTATGADALESVAVEISGLTTTTAVSEVGVLAEGFAVTSARLVSGDYLITVSSYNAADASAALDYKIALEVDSATRCAKSTAAVDYPEANDGITASGNDVFEVRYTGTPPRDYTALGNDAPEPTNITVAAGSSYHLTGVSSDPASAPLSWMDSYQDRDTYAITTGATTNVITVRLNWPGTTADLDFFVFPMDDLNEIATGWYNRNMEDEITTLAVTPSTEYWLMVGADDASTGQPIDYAVTVCGETFVPESPSMQALAAPRSRHHPIFQRRVRPLTVK